MSNLIYSGDKFRKFLSRRGLSYQDVAVRLGLDKNTIGKVVRGDNFSVNVLLAICNYYNLDINDFFECEEEEVQVNVFESSLREAVTDPPPLIFEPIWENVGRCVVYKKSVSQLEDIIAAKENEIILLREVNMLYRRMVEELQTILRNRGARGQ